ncbi:hypothetical protein SMC26_39795 [Actinomadura fulvescens]|uniref:Secreted protein n=1 Tax=Actinomadura fulvescens TaxID=46160 RepID=A0ABP6D902_9ACTN
MYTSNTIRAAVLAVLAAVFLGAAEECGSTSTPGAGDSKPCVITAVSPPHRDSTTGWITAYIKSRCSRPLGSIRVALRLEKHESGDRRNVGPQRASTQVPYPNERTYTADTACSAGRWRLFARITGTDRGKDFTLEKATRGSRIRC